MKNIDQILTASGLKKTLARKAVLEILTAESLCKDEGCGHHCELWSADDLHKEIKAFYKKDAPDRVTVYRVLKEFLSKEIVYTCTGQDGVARYEYANNHHHHIVCVSCGLAEQVESDVLEKAFQVMTKKLKHFKKALSHSVELQGVCTKCS
jgi:Fur family ferric uptake transcriptional regulator